MIHFSNTPQLQTVYVPKGHTVPPGAALTFTLRNTVDLEILVSRPVTDIGNLHYYHVFALAVGKDGDFNVDFNEDFFTWFPATPGEYKYEVSADGVVVATGIAIVSDYQAEIQAYEHAITYKQYEG